MVSKLCYHLHPRSPKDQSNADLFDPNDLLRDDRQGDEVSSCYHQHPQLLFHPFFYFYCEGGQQFHCLLRRYQEGRAKFLGPFSLCLLPIQYPPFLRHLHRLQRGYCLRALHLLAYLVLDLEKEEG